MAVLGEYRHRIRTHRLCGDARGTLIKAVAAVVLAVAYRCNLILCERKSLVEKFILSYL